MKRTLLALALSFCLLPLSQPAIQARTAPVIKAVQRPAVSQKDKIVHVLNRLTFGPSANDIRVVQAMGIDHYIDEQLHPESIPEAQSVMDFCSSSDPISKDPDQLYNEYGQPAIAAAAAEQGLSEDNPDGKMATQKIRGNLQKKVLDDTTKAKLLRAVESPRQLQEVMTEFWFNHFNIYSTKDRLWIGAYETQAIRPYAMGKFRDLLGATCHHAAMLLYLDNAQNMAPRTNGKKTSGGLNENYARELMELHTLGVDGGYTQQDVIEMARILTGLTTSKHDNKTGELKSPSSPTGSYFDIKRHDMGNKTLLGHTINGSGEDEIEQALDILAKQPATAHHICYQLAQYFVCDSPTAPLVDRLAAKFTQTDGDIQAVLKDIFHSPEFNDPANFNVKFKTPLRYLVSVMRVTGARPDDYAKMQNYLRTQGEPLYGCITPDGYKNVKEQWLNPDALVHRANFAVDVVTGKFRGLDPGPVDYRDLSDSLGLQFAPASASAIEQAPDNIKSALVLGSPEFMLY